MVKYASRNMNAGSAKARSLQQLEILVMEKLLNVGLGSIRDPYLCHVRIKVSRPIDNTVVLVERLDEHTHFHNIEESFRIKKPTILMTYIKSEVVKNYSPAQIFHALHGAGTHEGSVLSGLKNLVAHLSKGKFTLP